MAQLVVRKLREDIKARLRERARRHGRSMEQEARDILGAALAAEPGTGGGLGSRISARFGRIGLRAPIEEWRGSPVRPARFDP